MNKTAIKNFAIWARNKLIKEITYKAGLVGVTDKGIADALPQSTKDMQWFDIGTSEPSSIQGEAVKQREKLVQRIKEKEKDSDYKTAYTSIIEEVAYTWFNRLIAIRFMEVNDYLPSRVRVLSSETTGKEEPDLVTSPFDTDLDFTSMETERIIQYKDSNQLDELFRMLFIKQCNKLNEVLPELFEKTADYTELLLNISYTDKDGVVYHLTHDIDAEDFCVRENEEGQVTGQIEIIGWLYQYYNTEPKDEAFALLKKNVKVTKERIPAVTQLFTPEWIVKYMVENSLGRLWVEGHPDDELKKNWKYYLEEAEQEEDVIKQLEAIREEYKQLKPEDIKVIDPCMGSGHILVYAFEVLMQIYEANGYSQRDAAKSILENNIYGLDIDNRAYQLAYFALMMKARQYNRRILASEIKPNIYTIKGSNFITNDLIDFISGQNQQIKKDITSICKDLKDAEEYGSILEINPINLDLLYTRLEEIKETFYEDIFGQQNRQVVLNQIRPLIQQVEIMNKKYDIVVTNPPYMAISGADNKLNEYVKNVYPNSKMDLFAVFIEKCNKLTAQNGFQAMITQHSWMFLPSYEKLRETLQKIDTVNMAHQGSRGFEEIGGEVVQTTAFVFRNTNVFNYNTTYLRLTDYNSQKLKEEAFLNKKEWFAINKESFLEIPGAPIVYWMSKKFLEIFGEEKISKYAISDGQTKTGNNDKFLRLLWEVEKDKVGKGKKWVLHAKGGSFRRWYGNVDTLIDWSDKARAHYRQDRVARIAPEYIWFRKGLSWSLITSSERFAVRMLEENATFNLAAPSLFFENDSMNIYIIGLLNSKVAEKVIRALNPTLNTNIGDVLAQPLKYGDDIQTQKVLNLVEKNIKICQEEWNWYETAHDFKNHPLNIFNKKIDKQTSYTISEMYREWKNVADRTFEELKHNEEELNKIFLSIYKLQQEVTPEIDEHDVSIRKIDVKTTIISFVSYAIGCIFGRYSIDEEALVYAGGKWDDGKYTSFMPDKDNIILITEDEYFTDDMINRFVEFIKVVYGEETVEENLDFIANALGNKGNTSREVIRNYFIKDFYRDHCKTYQKRPIYWMFDSGKQNGFKALIYMHRYNADTIGNLRIDYLHRLQKVYESEIARMQDIVDNSNNAKESTAAAKCRDKLVKQLQETKDYDQKIAHLALARTEIDLDDGVKVNYEKVQTGTDGKKLEVLAKI